jgi:hypothetical protein
MQHLEGSGTPVLYVGRTVLKALMKCAGVEKQKTMYSVCAITVASAVMSLEPAM